MTFYFKNLIYLRNPPHLEAIFIHNPSFLYSYNYYIINHLYSHSYTLTNFGLSLAFIGLFLYIKYF